MTTEDRPHAVDDLDAYETTLTDEQREEVAAASVALDVALLAEQARLHSRITQAEAARRSGLKQQAISRIENATVNVTLRTLERYLRRLGYALELALRYEATHETVERITLNRSDDSSIDVVRYLGENTQQAVAAVPGNPGAYDNASDRERSWPMDNLSGFSDLPSVIDSNQLVTMTRWRQPIAESPRYAFESLFSTETLEPELDERQLVEAG